MITGRVVKNFTIDDMMCKDGTLIITPESIEHAQRLQKFRDWYNRAMNVNSWYRSPTYNKKVGGSPKSQHMQAIATDIDLPDEYFKMDKVRKQLFLNNIKSKWEELCKKDGLGGGVGWYSEFYHLDSRQGESLTTWDER